MKRHLSEPQKEFLMEECIGLMNRVSNLHTCHLTDITWRDHLAWFLDGILTDIYAWLYAGSDAEIRDVFDGAIPPKAMTERQLAALHRFDFNDLPCECCSCTWEGFLSETDDDFSCPSCFADSVFLHPFEEVIPTPLLLTENRAA